MHPEQPVTGCALQRQQADLGPEGAPSTGILQGFLQSVRPFSFCFLFPRVHAADVAAAQPAQMHSSSALSSSSSSSSTSLADNNPSSTVLNILGKPEFPDTGWDRIKDLFDKDVTQKYAEELSNVVKSGILSLAAGFIYGGLPAARHAREMYIEISQAEIYSSRVDAMRSSHNAAIRGFIRYGWRWGWRVSAFVTLFNSISTGLSVYRDKYTLSHYAAAGAVTGGLFRLNLGLRGLVGGSIIGAVVGLPIGALILSTEYMTGEKIRERRRRERREIYQLRLAEWAARMQQTEVLIGELNISSKPEESKKDAQRIEELLSLPPKETQDSSNQ